MVTWLPGFRLCRSKKTAGPFQSTWPAMTAGPTSPGVGPPVYQPAGKPLGGTCKDPSARNPRSINLESTPIASICRRTGTDLSMDAAGTTRGTRATMGGADTEGATAAPVPPEQPVAPKVVIVAKRATTITSFERAECGRPFTRWHRIRLRSLRRADDVDVWQRRWSPRQQRTAAHQPTE